MNKKIFSFTLFSVFLLSAVVSVAAQPRIPGVYGGNWFKYGDISVYWSSSDPNATVPSYIEGMNETEYVVISILDVIDTNVTCEMMTHFENETEETVGGYFDIDTGEGENATALVISAGLEENDTIYTSGIYSMWKINETVTRTYPDQTRDTNHINFTIEYSFGEFYQYMSMSYYWDRSAGILVEMSQESITQSGGINTTMSMLIRITESNVWVIPEFPAWIPTILVFLLFSTATFLSSRKMPIR